MGERRHVVVIGAGVIGLCTAWYARRRGFEVTVIDRGGPDRTGTSFGNAGMIVPSHFVPLAAPGMMRLALRWMGKPRSPLYVKPRLSLGLIGWGLRFARHCTARHVAASSPLIAALNLASRAAYEELAAEEGFDFGLVRNGLLMLCKTRQTLDAEAHLVEMGRPLGVEARVLDAGQTAELDPGVTYDIVGSVYFPADCHFDPAAFMGSMQRSLDAAGVRFAWNTSITGWRRSGTTVDAVTTDSGDIAGDRFVVAGGAWSPRMVRQLGVKLPMQAGKGYSLTLASPPQLPRICAIATEARVAITPIGSSLRLGGTMEIAGLDERINPPRIAGIVESVSRYLPRFRADDFAGVEPWVGLRPCSPDGLPYLGSATGIADNLVIATGHGMMGMSLGPITGKIAASLLAGEPSQIDIGPLSPTRYT